MDISPLGIVKNYIPAIPGIIKTTILAIIGWSPNAPVQDAITEIIAFAARPALSNPAALLKSQIQFKVDYGVWGGMWIAKYMIPRPESEFASKGGVYGVREAIKKAIKALGDGSEVYDSPQVMDVESEWTGYRGGVSSLARQPSISEKEKYDCMTEEVSGDSPVVLYFHGGAYCLMDPTTHRFTTSALAQQAGGRCLSIRYRLSPQYTFPSALLDALTAYLSLVSPPPGSFHTAIAPSQIIIAGDSSGAGLATSLLLLLLTLPRIGISHLRFHGKDVPVTCAGGLALTSPWLDISRALPSVTRNIRYDIIAPPNTDLTVPHPDFPHDSIWPTSPPRAETYCEAMMVNHPLVSPLAAHTDHWRGVPPVYMSVGWEGTQDESEVFSRRVYEAGGTVIFDGYKGMPHCFAIMPFNAAGRKAFANWASFCRQAAVGDVERMDYGTWTDKYGDVKEVKLKSLGMKEGEWHGREVDLDDKTVDQMLAVQREWREKLEDSLRARWKSSQ